MAIVIKIDLQNIGLHGSVRVSIGFDSENSDASCCRGGLVAERFEISCPFWIESLESAVVYILSPHKRFILSEILINISRGLRSQCADPRP